jgi:hypothetical protein
MIDVRSRHSPIFCGNRTTQHLSETRCSRARLAATSPRLAIRIPGRTAGIVLKSSIRSAVANVARAAWTGGPVDTRAAASVRARPGLGASRQASRVLAACVGRRTRRRGAYKERAARIVAVADRAERGQPRVVLREVGVLEREVLVPVRTGAVQPVARARGAYRDDTSKLLETRTASSSSATATRSRPMPG